MGSSTTPDGILAEIGAIRFMERGKVSEIRRPNGKVYHNLQIWRNGRNRCEYVPERDLEKVQEAVANYQRFTALVEEYAEVVERSTRRARKAKERDEKKGSVNRQQQQRLRK